MFSVDFAPAIIRLKSLLKVIPSRQKANSEFLDVTVGWFLLSSDIASASVRFRCFHMARAMEAHVVQQFFYTNDKELISDLAKLDLIVIVKRLDTPVTNIVAHGYDLNKPVFLDLCDDILAESYRPRGSRLTQMVFSGIAPFLDGIVVTGSAMAKTMANHCANLAIQMPPIHIIPDVAESAKILKETISYANTQIGKDVIKKAPKKPLGNLTSKNRKRIIWFGNYGAQHTNFGIMSLLRAAPALKAVNNDFPLELVVVSNSQQIYEAVIAPLGFPSHYVEWSIDSIYAELAKADVALLTSGDDAFCEIKSANRALQALAAGVPVVATSNPALGALGNSVILDRYEAGLRAYLGEARGENIAAAMTDYREKRDKYSLEKMAKLWLRIVKDSISSPRAERAQNANPAIILLESGQWIGRLGDVLEKCEIADIKIFLIITNTVCLKVPSLLDLLISYELTPIILSTVQLKRPPLGILRNSSQLVLEDGGGKISLAMGQLASEIGVQVSMLSDFAMDLDTTVDAKNNSIAEPNPAVRSFEQPGPYPETLEESLPVSWLFITHQDSKGWILDAVCREIGSRQSKPWRIPYNPARLPPSANYFFAHFILYLKHHKRSRTILDSSNSFVFYTHPRKETTESISELLEAFNQATKVIFMCSSNLSLWLERGLEPHRGCVVLGGADEKLFKGHVRGTGVIGISSTFYERKNPDLIFELVKMMQHQQFLLVGRNWEQYERFEELLAFRNFQYVTVPYLDYPLYYEKFDVFLSTSTLEGGPIPLIEAMMCNAVPVSSSTGFAPDVIDHGKNGFLFEADATATMVAPLIEAAFSLTVDVRESVQHCTWDRFSKQITSLGQ